MREFSPSQGSNNSWDVIISDSDGPKTWYYDVFSDYTPSGDNNSIMQHKLVFEAKNGNALESDRGFYKRDWTGSSLEYHRYSTLSG